MNADTHLGENIARQGGLMTKQRCTSPLMLPGTTGYHALRFGMLIRLGLPVRRLVVTLVLAKRMSLVKRMNWTRHETTN
ncbi:hypothetical protein AMC94_20650 [Pseudomonas amygdali pv. aesculi]|nr:hypothetical protein AL043_25265 [Pseudomonas amygdali pv. aesculi]KWT24578.1 hypothetical protein AL044_23145 [Pseudomonas amygdali pv. aesculi]KWT38313.1 hypothetical protein AMC94_20650 [Pseudomonas amygdali pv. aesculi]KWT39476.1 hypothetical protein AL045_02830 [Pseudomonas amygdali pv. aesculi]